MVRLVVGLGNPTPAYKHTRHNVGRDFIEFLASEEKIKFSKGRQSEILRLPVLLAAKLDCFMNESGVPIKKIMESEHIKPEEILIIVDDFMIPFGTLRLRPDGSSGGHNGLKSIIEQLSTDQFPRLRVGVGPVPENQDPKDFVLERFTKSEQQNLPKMFEAIRVGLDKLTVDGTQKTMNSINKDHLA